MYILKLKKKKNNHDKSNFPTFHKKEGNLAHNEPFRIRKKRKTHEKYCLKQVTVRKDEKE